MADKGKTAVLEGIGALLIIQGLGSLGMNLFADKEFGLLGLVDAPWWVALVVALAGIALLIGGDHTKKRVP